MSAKRSDPVCKDKFLGFSWICLIPQKFNPAKFYPLMGVVIYI